MLKRPPKLYVQFQREEKILNLAHCSSFQLMTVYNFKDASKNHIKYFLGVLDKKVCWFDKDIVILQDFIIGGEQCSWMQTMKLVIFYYDNVAKTSSYGLKIQGTLKLSISTWQFALVQVLQISNLRIQR